MKRLIILGAIWAVAMAVTGAAWYRAGKRTADRWYAEHWMPVPKLEIRSEEDDVSKVIWRRDPNQSRIFDHTIYMEGNVITRREKDIDLPKLKLREAVILPPCLTADSKGDSCDNVVAWQTPLPDENYEARCNGENPSDRRIMLTIVKKNFGSIQVRTITTASVVNGYERISCQAEWHRKP